LMAGAVGFPAMSRMSRPTFNLATVGSLLLCLLAGGLWIRSYFVR
jgi:hypothetical protein